LASFNVTAMVAAVTPSAGADAGLAVTVELLADTGPAVNVTAAVAVRITSPRA